MWNRQTARASRRRPGSQERVHFDVDWVRGSAVNFSSVIGLPFVRLRAAIPEEWFPGAPAVRRSLPGPPIRVFEIKSTCARAERRETAVSDDGPLVWRQGALLTPSGGRTASL